MSFNDFKKKEARLRDDEAKQKTPKDPADPAKAKPAQDEDDSETGS
ncbi:hypothetical protein [Roseovarius aestuariivivens]|nr:hypothetical protein [Roseovarius aestuariivivens]